MAGTGGGRPPAIRFCSCSMYLTSKSPILIFRSDVGILLTRISIRDRRPCAWRLYCARSLRARSVTAQHVSMRRRPHGGMGVNKPSSCRLSIRACFCCTLIPILCFLMGLLWRGVEGLPLSGTLLSAVAPWLLVEAVDWSEPRFFCRTGAILAGCLPIECDCEYGLLSRDHRSEGLCTGK